MVGDRRRKRSIHTAAFSSRFLGYFFILKGIIILKHPLLVGKSTTENASVNMS